MEDEDIRNMAYRIAEVFNENGNDARRAEPILRQVFDDVQVKAFCPIVVRNGCF
jgi:hypothetical protein